MEKGESKSCFLSNFWDAPVTYRDKTYQNAEAAFQAQKCIDEAEKEQFTALRSNEAKRLGRHVQLRPNWENVKLPIMEEIVRAKYTQNEELKMDGRPFETIGQMDEALIRLWNERVTEEDDVYIIGDFAYRNGYTAAWYLRQLKGRKHLIIGNHDRHTIQDTKTIDNMK